MARYDEAVDGVVIVRWVVVKRAHPANPCISREGDGLSHGAVAPAQVSRILARGVPGVVE